MPTFKPFSTPHCHIASLDSASTAAAFAARELELGTGTLTITDHGTLASCQTVYDLGHKKGLTPILGLEGYMRDDNCPILIGAGARAGAVKERFKYGHFTTHFLDQTAYKTCIKLLSNAPIERHGSENKPLFNWQAMEELGAANVTLMSGCLIGVVQRHLLDHSDLDTAKAYFDRMKAITRPGNFYVEVFPHICSHNWVDGVFLQIQEEGVAEPTQLRWYAGKTLRTNAGEIKAQELAREFNKQGNKHTHLLAVKDFWTWTERTPAPIVSVKYIQEFIQNECRPYAPGGDVQLGANKAVIEMAQAAGVPVAISDDSHYAHPDERVIQEIRLAQSGNLKFFGSYHRQSSAEAWEYFRSQLGISEKVFEGWIENSQAWASRFKDFKLESKPNLPTKFYEALYPSVGAKNSLEYAMHLIKEHGRMNWKDPVRVQRLQQEIKLLYKNGVVDLLPYFFLDEEVCRYYRDQGLLTGPGRGSAAGLSLAYYLGITHVDPLQYGLSLDRFLTPDRIKSGKLPDIDQDLSSRDLLVGEDGNSGWLRERFGDHVAQISTIMTLRLSSAVLDVARFTLGRVPPDIAALSKKFERPPQGLEDYKFVHGYEDSGNWIEGSITYDQSLQEYVGKYPRQWEIVQKCLGLGRSTSRHACLPATETVFTRSKGLVPIVKCDEEFVYTGQGKKKNAKGWSQNGLAKLVEQPGEHDVVEYTLQNGRKLRCTPDHKILTAAGWMSIQEAFEKQVNLTGPSCRIRTTEKEAAAYAKSRGGELVSWGGKMSVRSTWRCGSGHEWQQTGSAVMTYEYWCRKCSHKYRFTKTKNVVPIKRSASKCLNTYQRYDMKKGFVCNLTVEDVIQAKQSPCCYCGRQASGFERIDNKLGHTKENTAPACLRCNWMRGNYITHEIMLEVGKLLSRIDP